MKKRRFNLNEFHAKKRSPNTLQVSHEVYADDKLVKYDAVKIVTKCAGSSHIILPKGLIGKKVRVTHDSSI